ncbi:MAG TPA: AAA family ATPase [Streptosporangiaceae bacterium]|nr:AAA family ATPase [Streptosporangiaceae bacterium]
MPEIQVTLLGRFVVRVGGVPVADASWKRRHAAVVVKVLALAPGRRLHREQVIDLVWPEGTIAEAVPKLHKAAHFARRAIGVPDAVVLRGDQVVLCPGGRVTVDAVQFEELARRALAAGDAGTAREALALYGGELLPGDRYEEWAAPRREQLQRSHLDLLRLEGRWEAVAELDPGDERAHLALMRQYAATGDRHGALRQFERLDRALRQELGVAPGPEASALRDRLLADPAVFSRRDDPLIGRDLELSVADEALLDAAAGRSRTLLVAGEAGSGKSSLLTAVTAGAAELGLATGHGTAAPVEGAWPYAPVIEALYGVCRQDPGLLARLAGRHREDIERARNGRPGSWAGQSAHQPLFLAAAELVSLAAAGRGLLLTIDDVHDADDASLRLLHYLARSVRGQRVCIVLAHRPVPAAGLAGNGLEATRRSLIERHGATELRLGPLSDHDAAALIRRYVAEPPAELIKLITTLGRGVPFLVTELARQAVLGTGAGPGPAAGPDWGQALQASMLARLRPATREVLQRVAVAGSSFDTDEFAALSGVAEEEAFSHLDDALATGIIEPASTGYRFRHCLIREALTGDVPAHRRRQVHRDTARRLAELGASPARIGRHFLAAGAGAEAVPHLLSAAETESAVGAYRDALALVDAIRPHAVGPCRTRALSLRADLLTAIGDPMAGPAYRDALGGAGPADARRLRARLANSAVMAGDLATAAAALDGLDADGGADDADILLARGKYAFFTADFDAAMAAAEQAQRLILAGERNWQVLDLVTLRGLLAHRSDQWFAQMGAELNRTRDDPAMAGAIFDGYLCSAEYLLYGPTPYAEVMELARDLRGTAERSGARRAAAFARALTGEAALLSGHLDLAAAELTEASAEHRDLGSGAGEAHSLQRLAEVRLVQGDDEEARRLLERALPLARDSIVAKHLLHRVFGTMIRAAASRPEAIQAAERAESMLGWDDFCQFCSIMLAVPATIACARGGDLDAAGRHLAAAMRSAPVWRDTAWQAGLAEAQAAVAAASGDPGAARTLLQRAAGQFQQVGQPLDAERCRRTLGLIARESAGREVPARRRPLAGQAGGANSSRAMLSGSRNDRPEP